MGWDEFPTNLTSTYELFGIHYGYISNNRGGYAHGNSHYIGRGSIITLVIFSQDRYNDRDNKHIVLVLEQMLLHPKYSFTTVINGYT